MIEHISKFKKLPVWAQADILEKKAVMLAHRRHKEWEIRLYAFDNYYVELWEKQELKITTTFHKSARAMDVLEPYMETMRLQDLE